MNYRFLLLLFLITGCTCNDESLEQEPSKIDDSKLEIPFDRTKWLLKEGSDYPFREKMLNNVLFNDSIRSLDKTALIQTLGDPTRIQDEYLYYRIQENKALFMTLSTQTLVIKLDGNEQVEWMKIHE